MAAKNVTPEEIKTITAALAIFHREFGGLKWIVETQSFLDPTDFSVQNRVIVTAAGEELFTVKVPQS